MTGCVARGRRHLGSTIPHHRLRLRIQTARHLLETSTLGIAAVARRVGLPDAQHFNKVFRRFAGLSPTSVHKGR